MPQQANKTRPLLQRVSHSCVTKFWRVVSRLTELAKNPPGGEVNCSWHWTLLSAHSGQCWALPNGQSTLFATAQCHSDVFWNLCHIKWEIQFRPLRSIL